MYCWQAFTATLLIPWICTACVETHPAAPDCRIDSDCTGNQVCFESACYTPEEAADSSPPPTTDAAAPDAGMMMDSSVFPGIDCSLEAERATCIQCAIDNYADEAAAYAYHLLNILYCGPACTTSCQALCGDWSSTSEAQNRDIALSTWTETTVDAECNRCVGQIYANDRATTEELDRECAYDMPCSRFVRMLNICPN